MKSTLEAANELGISRNHLTSIISRHPGLRPKNRVSYGKFTVFQWTDEEIEVVREYRQTVKMGRPKKGGGGESVEDAASS